MESIKRVPILLLWHRIVLSLAHFCSHQSVYKKSIRFEVSAVIAAGSAGVAINPPFLDIPLKLKVSLSKWIIEFTF